MISPYSTGLVATLALAIWSPLIAVSAQEQTTATTEQGDPAHRALEQLFEHLDTDGDGQVSVRPAAGDQTAERRLPPPRARDRQHRSGQAPRHPPQGPRHGPPPRDGHAPGPEAGPRRGPPGSRADRKAKQPSGPRGLAPGPRRRMPPNMGPGRRAPTQGPVPRFQRPRPRARMPGAARPGQSGSRSSGPGPGPRAGGPPPNRLPDPGARSAEPTPVRGAMTEALLQSADANDDGMVSSAEWQDFCAQLSANK